MISDLSNPANPVRPREELDWARLDAFLKENIDGLNGNPVVSQYSGGASNLTYRIQYNEYDLVVRRPPFGAKAKSAHSMLREFRILEALKPVFSSVPKALIYSDDTSIIGSEFYVMIKVEGQLIKNKIPDAWNFDPGLTRSFCIRFWDKLIELHRIDIENAGVERLGKPVGYTKRQIDGWNIRFERAHTPDTDTFMDIRDWLAAHVTRENGRRAILHGDYRIDNVVFDSNDPLNIVAVLDWELSALGDPLMDLGNALAYWVQADDPDYLHDIKAQPSDAPGMLTRREILEYYGERTGWDTSEFTFYLVYGYWRNAVILQQNYHRYSKGHTGDGRFQVFGQVAQNLARHCRKLIRRAG